MNQTDAIALKDAFKAELARMGLYDPQVNKNNWTEQGNLKIEWSADHPEQHRRRGYYGQHDSVTDKFGVRLKIRGDGGIRTNKIYTDLIMLKRKVVSVINATSKQALEEDDSQMSRAQRMFDTGWCAFRLGFKVRSIDDRLQVKVRTSASNESWFMVNNHNPELDTLILSVKIASTAYYIDVRHVATLFQQEVIRSTQ